MLLHGYLFREQFHDIEENTRRAHLIEKLAAAHRWDRVVRVSAARVARCDSSGRHSRARYWKRVNCYAADRVDCLCPVETLRALVDITRHKTVDQRGRTSLV